MAKELDKKLSLIKKLEDEKTMIDTRIKKEREGVFKILQDENETQYKNDIATLSYIKRKTIRYDLKDEVVFERIKDIPRYFKIIPEEVIPEHKKLTKEFEDDIKSGICSIDGIEVEVKENPMIRFN